MKKQKKYVRRISPHNVFVLPLVIFLIVMVVVPLILLFVRAFSFDGGFSFANFSAVFTDGISLRILFRSIGIAALAATVCLIIGYPIAYGLAILGFRKTYTILLLFLMPMWVNLLLRSIGLQRIFQLLGMPHEGLLPLVIAIVIDYLPLMILPLYVVLSGVSKKYIEASADLGANGWQTFRRTILPLSLPGVVAGFLLVFTPAVSTYFLARFFGNNQTRMIGQVLFDLFSRSGTWGRGSVVAILLLVIVVFAFVLTSLLSRRKNKRGGLW